MSKELSISGLVKFSKGNVSATLGHSMSLDVTGTKYSKFIQLVGTSEEAIELGDLGSTPGQIIAINRDATNFVSIRSASGAADLIKIRPGSFAIFELAADAPYIIADTEDCEVEMLIIQD